MPNTVGTPGSRKNTTDTSLRDPRCIGHASENATDSGTDTPSHLAKTPPRWLRTAHIPLVWSTPCWLVTMPEKHGERVSGQTAI